MEYSALHNCQQLPTFVCESSDFHILSKYKLNAQ